MTQLRALTRLAFDELALGTGGIRQVHQAIADRAFAPGAAKALHDAIAGAVYASVRGGAALAGRASAVLPEREVSPALLGVLNGLRGDVLEPPLAIPMTLSVEGAETPRLAIFVHGLFETEHAWRYGGGPRYGDRLPGWTPVYVRYNTGRSISENGRELAERDRGARRRARRRGDRADRALDGRAGGVQRLPRRRRLDAARVARDHARLPAHGRAARVGRPLRGGGARRDARVAGVRVPAAPPQRRHPRPAAGPGRPAARERPPLLRLRHGDAATRTIRSRASSATGWCWSEAPRIARRSPSTSARRTTWRCSTTLPCTSG